MNLYIKLTARAASHAAEECCLRLKQLLRCMYLIRNNKVIKHVKICYYIFLSMISVEKAQYNSCCFFVVKRSKNYDVVVSRQNIRIRLLIVFIVWNQFCFVLFCFCETNFDVFTIFSELSGLKENALSWKYIYQWKAQSFH